MVSCKSKRDSNDDWQMIDFSDHARSVSPLSDPKTGQHETGYLKKKIFLYSTKLSAKNLLNLTISQDI